MTARKIAGLVAGLVMLLVLGLLVVVGAVGGEYNAAGGQASYECDDGSLTLPAAAAPDEDDGRQGIDTAARAALRAGWSRDDAITAVAIAGGESTYNPEAANPGSNARGMWQIMLTLHQGRFNGDDWRDPYANARVAHALWQESRWQPWVAYTSGSYRRFLDDAEAAVARVSGQDSLTGDVAIATGVQQQGLQPVAQRGYDVVRDQFGFTGTIGGYADRNIAGTNSPSKHSQGLAIDVMTSDQSVGDPIADYFAGPGYEAYGVENVIWRGRIYNAGRGWHPYSHPSGAGGVTLGHYDHVHIDFREGGGTGAAAAVAPLSYTNEQQCVALQTTGGGVVGYPVPANLADTDSRNFGGSGAMWSSTHTGTDFSVPCGTPVLAAHAGTAQIETDQGWAGPQLLKISTGPKSLTTWYAHMQQVDVEPGQQVQAGQQIGEVGNLGNTSGPTGCHLHFEVHPENGSIYADDTDPSVWLDRNVGKDLGGGNVAAVDAPNGGYSGNTLTLAQTNMTFQYGGDADLLAYTAARADVIVAAEGRGARGAMNIDPMLPGGWASNQVANDPSRGGTFVAWGSGATVTPGPPLRLAVTPDPGVRLGKRYLSEVVVNSRQGAVHVIAAHSPLRSTGQQGEYEREVAQRINEIEANGGLWAVGIDANRDGAALAAELGGVHYGKGRDGFVTSRRLTVTDVAVDDTPRQRRWTDHLLVTLTIAADQR